MTEVYADDTRYAKYGLLIAERDGKFGMVDKDGSVAVPFEYDYLGLHDRDNPQLGRVDDGYLFAYKDGKVGIIDVNHRIAVPFRYSPEEIYQFEYPQIRFSVRPVSKNEIECQADLSRLEELCKRQNWTYEWSAVIQVRQDGADSMNKLVQHFKKISESSLPEAIAIWENMLLVGFQSRLLNCPRKNRRYFDWTHPGRVIYTFGPKKEQEYTFPHRNGSTRLSRRFGMRRRYVPRYHIIHIMICVSLL